MTILITGASRGIGAEMAAIYTQQGQTVIGTSRGQDAEWPLDVTNPESHTALAAKLGDQSLDLLVCNAGVFLDRGQSLDTGYAPDLWAQSFAANVTGVFLTVQAFLPHLRRGGPGKIAIVSSQMGSSTRGQGGSYIYRASKAAATNLGRNLSVDLAAEGIAVGIYHPGWVRTDMGGSTADLDVQTSAKGLVQRFEALDIEATGCFEMYNGEAMPF